MDAPERLLLTHYYKYNVERGDGWHAARLSGLVDGLGTVSLFPEWCQERAKQREGRGTADQTPSVLALCVLSISKSGEVLMRLPPRSCPWCYCLMLFMFHAHFRNRAGARADSYGSLEIVGRERKRRWLDTQDYCFNRCIFR